MITRQKMRLSMMMETMVVTMAATTVEMVGAMTEKLLSPEMRMLDWRLETRGHFPTLSMALTTR